MTQIKTRIEELKKKIDAYLNGEIQFEECLLVDVWRAELKGLEEGYALAKAEMPKYQEGHERGCITCERAEVLKEVLGVVENWFVDKCCSGETALKDFRSWDSKTCLFGNGYEFTKKEYKQLKQKIKSLGEKK